MEVLNACCCLFLVFISLRALFCLHAQYIFMCAYKFIVCVNIQIFIHFLRFREAEVNMAVPSLLRILHITQPVKEFSITWSYLKYSMNTVI